MVYERYCSLHDTPADDAIYDQLKSAYQVYCQIGGYPKVIDTYLQERDMQHAQAELVKIMDTFTNESIRYFTDILDTRVFTQIFLSICRILNREKKGLAEDSLSEELQKLVINEYSSNISKVTCNRAISWLYYCGIIGFCFPLEIAFETPAFATYKGGEIDFVAQSLQTSTRYLIEVKSGKGNAPTSVKALNQGKADRLLYLKGDTKSGKDGKIETLPIYLLEKYKFS